MPVRWRPLAFALILIPLLTNVVVRSLGIVLLLAPDGLINRTAALIGLGPLGGMLYTHGAVALALAQVFMPFMVLSLYDVLQGTSPRVYEAADSLGASSTQRFLSVELPLSLPGLRAGSRHCLSDVVHGLCFGDHSRRQEGLHGRHDHLAGGSPEPQCAARVGSGDYSDRHEYDFRRRLLLSSSG